VQASRTRLRAQRPDDPHLAGVHVDAEQLVRQRARGQWPGKEQAAEQVQLLRQADGRGLGQAEVSRELW